MAETWSQCEPSEVLTAGEQEYTKFSISFQGLFSREAGLNKDDLFALERNRPGRGALGFANVLSFAIRNRNIARISHFTIIGCDRRRGTDRLPRDLPAPGDFQDSMRTARSARVEPQVIRFGILRSEQIVVRAAFPDENLKPTRDLENPERQVFILRIFFPAFHVLQRPCVLRAEFR